MAHGKNAATLHFSVLQLLQVNSAKKIIVSIVKSTYCKSCEVWKKKKDTDREEYKE